MKKKLVTKNIKASDVAPTDPFSGSIDEFLKEKQEKQEKQEDQGSQENEPKESADEKQPADSPMEETSTEVDTNTPTENLEDAHKEETGLDLKKPDTDTSPNEELKDDVKEDTDSHAPAPEMDAPQDILDDKVDDSLEESKEEKVDELEDQKDQIDEHIDTLSDEQEKKIESRLKKIADEATRRGYRSIASLFLKACGGVPEVLNKLLMNEYLILDILNNYFYLFTDASTYSLYDPKDIIKYLQKQIVGLGAVPTTQRLVIPKINPATAEGILALVKEHTKVAAAGYLSALKVIDDPDLAVLKVNLQNIIAKKRKLF